MKKIGLIDVDGYHFPNLALMKISAHHKAAGDSVEWYNHLVRYDRVYMAKVFTFTPDYRYHINAGEVVKGGTGYDISTTLPHDIEAEQPDYTLYPLSKWYNGKTAYGFLTRGCIRNCSWCIVPQKEGSIAPHHDIEDILQGRNAAVLMDNNVLACDYGIGQVEKIVRIGCRVDFNQGLDARIIVKNPALPKMLSRIKWITYLRLACDSAEMMKTVAKAAHLLRKNGLKPHRFGSYVLLTDLESSYERINFLRNLDILPFAQPYRDFTPNQAVPQWQKDMAHWCNRKELLKTVDFKDFSPRRGFKCSAYFEKQC